MDPRRFDTWTRSVFGTRSRRAAVQLLVSTAGGGLLTLLGRKDVAACAKPGEGCNTKTCCDGARCQDNRCVRNCPAEKQCGEDDCCNLCETCLGGFCSALKPTCNECQELLCPSTGEYTCVAKCEANEGCCRGKCLDSCKDCKGQKTKCLSLGEGHRCVNLKSDPKHCGKCGNACGVNKEGVPKMCCNGTCCDRCACENKKCTGSWYDCTATHCCPNGSTCCASQPFCCGPEKPNCNPTGGCRA